MMGEMISGKFAQCARFAPRHRQMASAWKSTGRDGGGTLRGILTKTKARRSIGDESMFSRQSDTVSSPSAGEEPIKIAETRLREVK